VFRTWASPLKLGPKVILRPGGRLLEGMTKDHIPRVSTDIFLCY